MKTISRVFLLTGMLLLVCGPVLGQASSCYEDRPEDVQMDALAAPVVMDAPGGVADVLLVQDVLPWGYNSNTVALTASGATFHVTHSSALASVDLNDYRILMYASDQYTSYYNNLMANMSAIEDFVEDGGLLLAQACDLGWHGGSWLGGSILPGGVTHNGLSEQAMHILIPDHEVIVGDGSAPPLTDADLSGWNLSTHGHFTNMPAGADVVIEGAPGHAVCIDYSYGEGRVIATMQTGEWAYHHGYCTGFLTNLIDTALAWSPFGELEMIEANLDVIESKMDAQPDLRPSLSALHLKINNLINMVSILRGMAQQGIHERAALEAKLDRADQERAALETKLDEMTQRTLAPGQKKE